MSGLLLLRRPPHVRCLSSRLSQVRHYALIGKPRASEEPRWVLPKTPARTRFAPSPTGYLHLGSLRTALYNYLLAQATGGQFIVRLEDTDQARFVHDAEQVLYDDLRWAGLNWDEGPDKGGPFGPYKQSERLSLYKQHAQSLLESGHAFRCFCTKEDIDFNIKQATSSGGAAHYPGTCTHIEKGESDRRAANGEPHVIRFKSAEKPVPALDLVYGTYKKAEREDNFIIMKSDGFPTYHFANVVDDHFMEITHVIRGAEWLISTPKHVELYNAFGWQPPNFAHVGLLVDGQRQKLSKRDMANIGIGVYRLNNVLPEALLNFSALLGWDPNLQKNTSLNKRGVMTLEEMKQHFTLKFTRGDIVVDLSKLKFFQKQLTRKLVTGENPDSATLRTHIIQPILSVVLQFNQRLVEYQHGGASTDTHLHELFDSIAPLEGDSEVTEDYVLQVLRAWKGPIDDPFQFVLENIFAFYRPSKKALRKQFHELQSNMARIMIILGDRQKLINSDISKVLRTFTQRLKRVDEADWTAEKLGDIVKRLTDSVKFYDTADDQDKFESAGWTFMRHALINGKAGSAIVPLMLLLGQTETVYRIRSARKVATEEEDRLSRGAERTQQSQQSTEATKVRIRNMDDLLRRKANQNPASRSPDRDIEPRNVKITTPRVPAKALTPPGMGPFGVVLQNEKGREEIPEGPFKSRPPTPRPPRPPPRDPSEVERSPQFLSYTEFKSATRHIDLPKQPEDNSPAFWAIEPPQRQQGAQFDAANKSMQGEWARPKSASQQSRSGGSGRTAGRGVSNAGDPIGIDYHNRLQHATESNISPTVKRAQRITWGKVERPSAAPTSVANESVARDDTSRDMNARGLKMPGPFRIETGNELPVDRNRHVRHLRALNISLAARRAATRKPGSPEKIPKSFGRFDQLRVTGPSPMSRFSGFEDKPEGVESSDTEDDSIHAYDDGEKATALAPRNDRPAMHTEFDRLGDVLATDLDYLGKRQAAAERLAKEQTWKKEKASLAQVEEQMTRQWVERNR